MTQPDRHPGWIVELDQDLCTLCEGCVKACPTAALRLDRTDAALSLVFDSSLCHGCPQGDSCQDICPEDAIRLVETEVGAGGESVLVSSPLIRCISCGTDFAAAQKLDALARAGRVHHELVRDLCPVCRREQLVVSFIEEERARGSKAKYRSTTKILRDAGKLRDG